MKDPSDWSRQVRRARRRLRLRTSTLALVAVFVGATVLYLFVRPTTPSTSTVPASATTHR